MTAKGKINASRVQAGDRILVQLTESGSVSISATKTGAGVQVARVTGKTMSGPMGYGTRRGYNIQTTAGELKNLAPIQTMWLAPEDAAGIKRAHAEAVKLEREREDRRFLKAAATLATDPAVRAQAQALLDGEDAAQETRTREEEPAGRFTLEAALEAVGMAPDPVEESAEEEVPPAPSLHQYMEKIIQAGRKPGMALELKTRQVPSLDAYRSGGFPAAREVLAQELAGQELAEHLEPEEVRAPKDLAARCQARDVVTIHRGDRLYEVLEVVPDSSRNNITGEVTDHTLARVAPLDPEDFRDAQWVHVDLLHVRKPVARIYTEEVTGRVRQTREVFTLGERLVAVRTILMDSRRLPVATLVVPPLSLAAPVGTLRVGEAIVVDGRCYAVTGEGELEPAPHRDRLKATQEKWA